MLIRFVTVFFLLIISNLLPLKADNDNLPLLDLDPIIFGEVYPLISLGIVGFDKTTSSIYFRFDESSLERIKDDLISGERVELSISFRPDDSGYYETTFELINSKVTDSIEMTDSLLPSSRNDTEALVTETFIFDNNSFENLETPLLKFNLHSTDKAFEEEIIREGFSLQMVVNYKSDHFVTETQLLSSDSVFSWLGFYFPDTLFRTFGLTLACRPDDNQISTQSTYNICSSGVSTFFSQEKAFEEIFYYLKYFDQEILAKVEVEGKPREAMEENLLCVQNNTELVQTKYNQLDDFINSNIELEDISETNLVAKAKSEFKVINKLVRKTYSKCLTPLVRKMFQEKLVTKKVRRAYARKLRNHGRKVCTGADCR